MYRSGDGICDSGRCNNFEDSKHSCIHSSNEKINIHYSTDDYKRGTMW